MISLRLWKRLSSELFCKTVFPSTSQYNFYRCASSSSSLKNNVSSKLTNCYEKICNRVNRVVDKYVPQKIADMAHVYVNGIKELKDDIYAYVDVRDKIKDSPDAMRALNLNELILYHQVPKDLIKMAPIIIITCLPFITVIIVPIALGWFPDKVLTIHFWTPKQKLEFPVAKHNRLQKYYQNTIKNMLSVKDLLKENQLHGPYCEMIDKINRGDQPSTKLILKCLPIFVNHPLGLFYLSIPHTQNLSSMHGIFIWSKRKLTDHAKFLYMCDRVIIRKGGKISNISDEQLKQDNSRYYPEMPTVECIQETIALEQADNIFVHIGYLAPEAAKDYYYFNVIPAYKDIWAKTKKQKLDYCYMELTAVFNVE